MTPPPGATGTSLVHPSIPQAHGSSSNPSVDGSAGGHGVQLGHGGLGSTRLELAQPRSAQQIFPEMPGGGAPQAPVRRAEPRGVGLFSREETGVLLRRSVGTVTGVA